MVARLGVAGRHRLLHQPLDEGARRRGDCPESAAPRRARACRWPDPAAGPGGTRGIPRASAREILRRSWPGCRRSCLRQAGISPTSDRTSGRPSCTSGFPLALAKRMTVGTDWPCRCGARRHAAGVGRPAKRARADDALGVDGAEAGMRAGERPHGLDELNVNTCWRLRSRHWRASFRVDARVGCEYSGWPVDIARRWFASTHRRRAWGRLRAECVGNLLAKHGRLGPLAESLSSFHTPCHQRAHGSRHPPPWSPRSGGTPLLVQVVTMWTSSDTLDADVVTTSVRSRHAKSWVVVSWRSAVRVGPDEGGPEPGEARHVLPTARHGIKPIIETFAMAEPTAPWNTGHEHTASEYRGRSGAQGGLFSSRGRHAGAHQLHGGLLLLHR